MGSCVSTSRSGGEPVVSASKYNGKILDPHIHVFFDERVAKGAHKTNSATPKAVRVLLNDTNTHAGLMVMATGSSSENAKQNDQIIVLAKSIPNAFAVGSVNPNNKEAALKELERMVQKGVRWLKLHPNTQRFDVSDATVAQIVKRAGELGVPVTFDASMMLDADQLGKFLMLAITNPETDIVLAHMGGPRFDELSFLKAFEMYPWWQRNLWLDISFTLPLYARSPRRDSLIWTMRAVGMDRVLFASDYPASTPQDTKEAVESLSLSTEEQNNVFYGNASQLLKKEAEARRLRQTSKLQP